MLFGCITNIPKFTSFVFSKSLHAREIKPTRKKQIFYDFTPTMPGPKMSQRNVSYGVLSFSQKTQMSVSGFWGAFLFSPLPLKLLRKQVHLVILSNTFFVCGYFMIFFVLKFIKSIFCDADRDVVITKLMQMKGGTYQYKGKCFILGKTFHLLSKYC